MALEGRIVKGEGPDAGWADVKRLSRGMPSSHRNSMEDELT